MTDAQRAAIEAHVDRWIEVGRCTDPADWRQFEQGAEAATSDSGEAERLPDNVPVRLQVGSQSPTTQAMFLRACAQAMEHL